MLHSFLFANSCPKWAPIAIDDIFTVIPIYPSGITAQDSDCDGVSDVDEQANGTNPNNPDTDGDGVNDYRDDYPLNPNLSTDTSAPVLTLKGSDPMVIYRYIPFKDPGAVAIDDRDGRVSVATRGYINTHVPNTYTLFYSAKDAKGNTSVKRRTVIVNPEIRAQVIVKSAALSDATGQKPGHAVDAFIKAYLADDDDTVAELVGKNKQLLALLNANTEVTTFLKRLYSHTYKIEGTRQTGGEASVTISFFDNNDFHKGGFELLLSTDADGDNKWIISQIY